MNGFGLSSRSHFNYNKISQKGIFIAFSLIVGGAWRAYFCLYFMMLKSTNALNTKINFGLVFFISAYSFSSVAQMTAFANIFADLIASIRIRKSDDLTTNQTKVSQTSIAGTATSFSTKGSNLNAFIVTPPLEALIINTIADYTTVSIFTVTTSTANALQINSRVLSTVATLKINGTQLVGDYYTQDSLQLT